MDARRFDDLARAVAAYQTRRRFVAGLTLGSIGWLAPRRLVSAPAASAKAIPAAITVSCTDCVDLCKKAKKSAVAGACITVTKVFAPCRVLGPVCKAVAGTVCGKLGGHIPLPCDDICTSRFVDAGLAFLDQAGAVDVEPCPDRCESGLEPCRGGDPNAEAICVPSCPNGRLLDQDTCSCPPDPCAGADCGQGRYLNESTCQCEDIPEAESGGTDANGIPEPLKLEDETGKGFHTKRWAFVVPDGMILVVEGYFVFVNGDNMGGPGVYLAYGPGTPVDLLITDGAYALVDEAAGRSALCQRVERAIQDQLALETVQGLPEWGDDPCAGEIQITDERAVCRDDPQCPCDGATGPDGAKSWPCTVPDGMVLIVSTLHGRVNGEDLGGPGVYKAYPAGTFVYLELENGAYYIIPGEDAQAKFCEIVAQNRDAGNSISIVEGLPEWGDDPC
jgi:hypothetical protein